MADVSTLKLTKGVDGRCRMQRRSSEHRRIFRQHEEIIAMALSMPHQFSWGDVNL
jgi:hypothetical protein